MARDELIFDSERQGRKAERKRRLLPLLLPVGLVLVVFLVAILIRAGNRNVHRSGEELTYPYTWEPASDGTLRLAVSHDDAKDQRWSLAEGGAEEAGLQITRAEKESGGSTVFTLTPARAGRFLFTLALAPEGGEATYTMDFLAEVTGSEEAFETAILNAAGRARQGSGSGGTESANPYRFFVDDDGFLVVALTYLEENDEQDWTAAFPAGEDVVEALGPIYEGQEALFYLRGLAAGEAELVLESERAATRLTLGLSSDAEGTLRVTSHEAVYGEKPVIDENYEIEFDDGEGESTAP